MKNGVWVKVPCDSCEKSLRESNRTDKLQAEDKLIMLDKLCPKCWAAIEAAQAFAEYFTNNFNEKRVSKFKIRPMGKFTEVMVDENVMRFKDGKDVRN
jgi:uncharacterized protein CbrC (UPF0167 family)